MLAIRNAFLGQDTRVQAFARNTLVMTTGLVLGISWPGIARAQPSGLLADACVLTGLSEPSEIVCDRPSKSDKALSIRTKAALPPAPINIETFSTGDTVFDQAIFLADANEFPALTQTVEIDPAIIESSPVLRRWLEDVPDVSVDIQHDPAFRPRLRIGYTEFPSTDNQGGFYIGIQDVFIGRTPLTISAEYSADGQGDRELIGADAQYYLLPLGWYGNVAPVLGYRSIDNSTFESSGINVGVRIILVPSRTGAADLSLTQSWVAPGTENEVGLTTFSAGYAIAEDLRIGTDIQTQNTRDQQESRVSVLIEWML